MPDMTPERTAWLCHVAFHCRMYGHMDEALDACLDSLVDGVLAYWVKHPDTAGELPVGEVAYLNGLNLTERLYVRGQAANLLKGAVKASNLFGK